MAYAQLSKSNHGDFVYRLLREDEDPCEDLISKNEHATYSVSKHVEKGSRLNTQFISTSKSLSQVRKMAKSARKNDPDRDYTIVAINMKYIKNNDPNIASNAFDFTNENDRLDYLKNDKQDNYAKKMKEVVFEDSIPREAVNIVDIIPGDICSDGDYSENSESTDEDESEDDCSNSSDSNYQDDNQNNNYSKPKYYNNYSKPNNYYNKNSKPNNNNNYAKPKYYDNYSKPNYYDNKNSKNNNNNYSKPKYYNNYSKPNYYDNNNSKNNNNNYSKPKYYNNYNPNKYDYDHNDNYSKPSYYSKYSKYKY